MTMRVLSCAPAGKAAPAAKAAAPPSAVRRLIMKARDMKTSSDSSLLVEYLTSGGRPADMYGLADFRREPSVAVGDLHHQPVVGRQAHVDVDQGAEIGPEFHRTRQAVVEAGAGVGADLEPLGPERQGGAAGPAVVAGQEKPSVRAEMAGRLDRTGEEGAATHETRHEAIGRAFVEVALVADLVHRALVHDHQPVGHGERFLLV